MVTNIKHLKRLFEKYISHFVLALQSIVKKSRRFFSNFAPFLQYINFTEEHCNLQTKHFVTIAHSIEVVNFS